MKETLTELWNRFWIVRGRSLTNEVIKQCRVCRRYEGRPYSAPQPPPLPTFRVEEATFTRMWLCWATLHQEWYWSEEGVDLPFHLLCGESYSLQTWALQHFSICFRCFVRRRGLLKQMVSDNDDKTSMQWPRSFKTSNVLKAPWCGGVFKGLVRSVKWCLKKMLGWPMMNSSLHLWRWKVSWALDPSPLFSLKTLKSHWPLPT